MECPECRSEIHNAPYCGCGWRRKPVEQKAESQKSPCAHDGCVAHAVCRIKTPQGWANLCYAHYHRYHLESARKTCESLNLKTMEEKRKWVAAKMPGLYKTLEKPMREPGEDEDFTYVQA